MRAGFYSPLPPARTGVADYSAALLNALRACGEVELAPERPDIALYHLGNNQLHGPCYRRSLQQPGAIVLHDAVLHHFLLGTLSQEEYVREFTYNYGDWTQDTARNLWRERARSAADERYFRYPLLKRVVTSARGVIVHNPAAADAVRQHAPAAKVFEIPHLFSPPAHLPGSREVEQLRSRLGLSNGVFLFGVFGHLRESKRPLAVLRAFERARQHAPCALLVAGEIGSRDLRRSLETLLGREGVLRAGYLSESDFWTYAAATDACINLRHPSAGETSGIGVRFMGLGKPVIFTAGPETARYPEGACLRVDHGPGEEETLSDYLVWLASHPEDAREIGRHAAQHIAVEHTPHRAASLYWQALERLYHGD